MDENNFRNIPPCDNTLLNKKQGKNSKNGRQLLP